MRTTIAVSFFMILILTNRIHSQTRDILKPEQLLRERSAPNSNPDKPIRMTLNSDNFGESKSRTIIKDQALENGFLLVETILQNLDGSNWVNSDKTINSYLSTGIEQCRSY